MLQHVNTLHMYTHTHTDTLTNEVKSLIPNARLQTWHTSPTHPHTHTQTHRQKQGADRNMFIWLPWVCGCLWHKLRFGAVFHLSQKLTVRRTPAICSANTQIQTLFNAQWQLMFPSACSCCSFIWICRKIQWIYKLTRHCQVTLDQPLVGCIDVCITKKRWFKVTATNS